MKRAAPSPISPISYPPNKQWPLQKKERKTFSSRAWKGTRFRKSLRSIYDEPTCTLVGEETGWCLLSTALQLADVESKLACDPFEEEHM
jgi:hypothetical protein